MNLNHVDRTNVTLGRDYVFGTTIWPIDAQVLSVQEKQSVSYLREKPSSPSDFLYRETQNLITIELMQGT